jgi:hypothetical protein
MKKLLAAIFAGLFALAVTSPVTAQEKKKEKAMKSEKKAAPEKKAMKSEKKAAPQKKAEKKKGDGKKKDAK